MKTMNCKQPGGACETEFRADTFAGIAQLSQQHGREMFEKKDAAHLEAMAAMRELMQKPQAMQEWYAAREREFAALPES